MKLVTFQSFEALKYLINNKYLMCDEKYINIKKSGHTYDWLVKKMKDKIPNTSKVKYPIWAWVKCYNGICPAKRKGLPIKGYDVKITFHKNPSEVFITDFCRFSFLLNNTYIPESLADKERFNQKLKNLKITEEELQAYVRCDKYSEHRKDKAYLDVCQKIEESFDKCITTDSDILQGCVWQINLEDIESIEILNDQNYSYGSINYIRKNGNRINWREDYYKKLK